MDRQIGISKCIDIRTQSLKISKKYKEVFLSKNLFFVRSQSIGGLQKMLKLKMYLCIQRSSKKVDPLIIEKTKSRQK